MAEYNAIGLRPINEWVPSNVAGCPVGRSVAGPVGRSVAGPVGRSVAGPVGRSVAGPVGRSVAGPVGRSVAGPRFKDLTLRLSPINLS